MSGVLIPAGQHDHLMDLLTEELDQLGDDHTGLAAVMETFVLATNLLTPDRPLSRERNGFVGPGWSMGSHP